jgi:CRISPR-associated endonuclease Csn1
MIAKEKSMGRVLGLDVGSNSLGWAIVDQSEDAIIGMGVRVFTAGVDNLNGEKEESRNAQRRLKRQLRRQYERTRQRRNALRWFLIENGLLPNVADDYADLLRQDPYALRKKGLDHDLEPFEIGRIVDHINARRGFRSNRKASSDEESSGVIYEGSKDDAKPGINAINDELQPMLRSVKLYESVRERVVAGDPDFAKVPRTAGEYLAGLNPREVRRRKRFLLREHLEIELDLILRKQAQFHSMLTHEVIDRIKSLVFWQRPLKSVRKLVGNCRFEPGKKRCHKSHPQFQRFRLLQQLNQFEVYGPGRVLDDDSKLTAAERSALERYLTEKKSIDTVKNSKDLYKILGLTSKADYRFKPERLDACTTMIKLREVFGPDRLALMSTQEIHEVWNVFNLATDAEWLEEYSVRSWGLTRDQAKTAAKVRLEDGYGSLSLRAIGKILPHLELGYMYHEACELAGYHHSRPEGDVEVSDVVPAMSNADVRNPIVLRSYSEMRRVVNLLIKRYGPFESIRVELGRELKKPKFERLKIEKRNKDFRDANELIRQRLRVDFGIQNPSRSDIDRYRLWEEQNHKCIYTGKAISQDSLFSGPIDVDHILPYSRTLDDGRSNKVLCLREINLAKGNMTPVEACDAGIIIRTELRERVEALVRANKYTKSKSVKFFMSTEDMQKIYGDDFVERQLNDTRYVGRLTAQKLRFVCKDVVVTNGLLTSSLRRRWGLDAILPDLAADGRAWLDSKAHSAGAKSRADHRHHAVDALVVALTSRSLLAAVAKLNARGLGADVEKHYADGRIRLPEEPLAGLKAMARQRVDSIAVSHAVNRKRRGQLHEETIYGIAHDEHGVPLTNDAGIPLYVVRKPVESLTASMVEDIVDPAIKALVLERLSSLGVDVSSKYIVPKTAFLEPLYMLSKDGKRGPRIKRVRIYKASSNMVQLRVNGAFAEPGSNDHIRLYDFDAVGKKRKWRVLSLFESLSARAGLPDPEPPIMTLRINEMYLNAVPLPGDPIDSWGLYRVQYMDKKAGTVAFRHHSSASINDNASRLFTTPNTTKGVKVHVNSIGEVVFR